MRKLTRPLFLFFLFSILFQGICGAENTENKAELQPVTMGCVYDVATNYNVPMPVLVAILKVEGGTIGTKFKNLNGTTDLGPGLINSKWVANISHFGVTAEMLQNNGCVNVMVLGWILKKHEAETGSIWKAVGKFHSQNTQQQRAYTERVHGEFLELANRTKYDGAKKVIAKANDIQ